MENISDICLFEKYSAQVNIEGVILHPVRRSDIGYNCVVLTYDSFLHCWVIAGIILGVDLDNYHISLNGSKLKNNCKDYFKNKYGCMNYNDEYFLARVTTEADFFLENFIESITIVHTKKFLQEYHINFESSFLSLCDFAELNTSLKWLYMDSSYQNGLICGFTLSEIYNFYLESSDYAYAIPDSTLYFEIDSRRCFVIKFSEKFNLWAAKAQMLGDKHFRNNRFIAINEG